MGVAVVGIAVGTDVGEGVGLPGSKVGALDGDAVGSGVDFPGKYVGSTVGEKVGELDGKDEGEGVG